MGFSIQKEKVVSRYFFFEYSNSKFVILQPEIVEFKAGDKPVFDLIIGTNTMEAIGIILNFFDKVITIDQIVLPMRSIEELPASNKRALRLNNSLAKNQEPKSTELATRRIVEILDAKYEKANLPELVENECSHLNPVEKLQLLELLTEFEDLFDGTLGDWDTEPVSFQLKEGTTPYHGRAYPIPQKHKATVKTEVKRLCEIGVLEWQAASEWASPSFIQPKKNDKVRFLTDFREVNKRLVRKPYPLPIIQQILQELLGFMFATALDLNMGYYTIRLDPDASRICNIIFPWGKYSYLRLPMGVSGSADIFQGRMSQLMMALD